jgi:hypothetical protein
MSTFNGFFDNLQSGVLNPKGNLADWQHASRLFVNQTQKFAPKTKFLYHVSFFLTRQAQQTIPELQFYTNEIGMLVNSADLPSYTANVETKNKYNRKKNTQTNIEYQPVSIDFFDDNYGATTAMLEAYYRYYFADGNQSIENGAYGKKFSNSDDSWDTTYKGTIENSFKFGLDNKNHKVPFFDRIEISQLHRKNYTTYTLINPIITSWNHDSVDNSDNSSPMRNTIQVAYEAVLYDRGPVRAGAEGEPTGFGQVHYDTTPSPLTLAGGGTSDVTGLLASAVDLYGYITQGANFSNPFEAAITGVNLYQNVQSLNSEALREQGLNLAGNFLGNLATGIPQTIFPKSRGEGGTSGPEITEATPSVEVTPLRPSPAEPQPAPNTTTTLSQQELPGIESPQSNFSARLEQARSNVTISPQGEVLVDNLSNDGE